VVDRYRKAVPLASAPRQIAVEPVDADDVVDPFRRTQEVYDRSFSIRSTVETIADRLVPHSGYVRR
jgi:hypothetical protein